MQGSVLQHDLRKVISIVDLLRDIGLDKQLSLPKVVVLGNQSSGKSSLLEQIVGLDFLPRGSGVVTRRPLQLRMNNVPGLKQPYAEFDQITQGSKKKKFTDFNKVRQSIDEVTQKLCGKAKIIIDNPIVLNVFSASCPNLTVVDLPGITSIPVGDQPKNIYEITRDMAFRYIKQPRSIILCVIPANQDLSTSEALKTMRQIDPSGERSIGCLTKIDIMNRGDDARNVLKNQEIPLRYGYVGIKNRCQQDVINNVPVSESLKQEMKFFTTSPIYSTLPPGTFGTEALTSKLTSILYQQIKASMPQIFDEIKKKKQQSQDELDKLGPGVASTDAEMVNYAWKSISSFLRIFMNSINGIKNIDYQSDPISADLREQLNILYKEQYEEPATEDLSDKDIEKAMINYPGDSTIPGFPSIDAFLALLNPLLKKLQTPAYQVNNRIHEIMEHQARDIIDEVMIKKFPEFNVRFLELIRRVLQKHRRDLELYLNSLLDAELTYLYTNDTSYLMNDFNLTAAEKKKLESGKIKDPLIFELRKRIDSYYKLVVRNLRDLIPKQVFYFLISKCLKELEFEAFQFTSDVNKLKEWLNEPSQVRKKRTQCMKAIKVFQESEKRIRMDPEISKLIKNTKRESKYYHKFGMKTPEELEEISLQKQKKLYESKAQQAIRKSSIANDNKGSDKRVDSKGSGANSGKGSGQVSNSPSMSKQDSTSSGSTSQSNQSKGNSSGPSPSGGNKGNAMFNMFGENVGDKKDSAQQPSKQNPPPSKDSNTANLFGNPPMTKQSNNVGQGTTDAKSSNSNKRNLDFNFEESFKNEGRQPTQQSTQQSTQQQVNSPPPVQSNRNPIGNPPKSSTQPEQRLPTQSEQRAPTQSEQKAPTQPDQKPPIEEKKRATFNNLFGLK